MKPGSAGRRRALGIHISGRVGGLASSFRLFPWLQCDKKLAGAINAVNGKGKLKLAVSSTHELGLLTTGNAWPAAFGDLAYRWGLLSRGSGGSTAANTLSRSDIGHD